ncbi:hypothetical protein [Azospirillum sp. sgz302134]
MATNNVSNLIAALKDIGKTDVSTVADKALEQASASLKTAFSNLETDLKSLKTTPQVETVLSELHTALRQEHAQDTDGKSDGALTLPDHHEADLWVQHMTQHLRADGTTPTTAEAPLATAVHDLFQAVDTHHDLIQDVVQDLHIDLSHLHTGV